MEDNNEQELVAEELEAAPSGHAVYDNTLLKFVTGVFRGEDSKSEASEAQATWRKGEGKGHRLEVREV